MLEIAMSGSWVDLENIPFSPQNQNCQGKEKGPMTPQVKMGCSSEFLLSAPLYEDKISVFEL